MTPTEPFAHPFTVPEEPTTPRGQRTRAALVEAARTVFERDGFLESRVIDITTEARCSAGTFYTYFENKEQAFAAVLLQVKEEMLHPGLPHVPDDGDPRAVIEASTRAYLETYGRNARLMALMEQVANISPEFQRLRRDRGAAFVDRNARSIADLQTRGLADPDLDPELASRSLSGMISRLAFFHFVVDAELGEPSPADLDALVGTASRLWANALRLPDSSHTRPSQE